MQESNFKHNPNKEYVGTSLSKCVESILTGEMDYNNVIGMITNTRIKDINALYEVIEGYFGEDYGYWSKLNRAEASQLVIHMYFFKPFYQPRLTHGFVLIRNDDTYFRDQIWMEATIDTFSPWYTTHAEQERSDRFDDFLLLESSIYDEEE